MSYVDGDPLKPFPRVRLLIFICVIQPMDIVVWWCKDNWITILCGVLGFLAGRLVSSL